MAFRWRSVTLTDDNGKLQTGVAPVIVSASRSTDIPAFFSEWLLNRLCRGYCVWINPFNGAPQYVSFDSARFFVFWSKNPLPIMKRLPEIDRFGIGYYFQFTLNDYDNEHYEPRVPSVTQRIETFRRLSDQIGPSRVIWRFDPLLLTDQITAQSLLSRLERLMSLLHKHTEKFVFSFADLAVYQKVQQNLRRAHIGAREFQSEEMFEIARQIGDLGRSYGISVATCAEQLDFSSLGIEHNRCIDDELMARSSPNDNELLKFLGRRTVPVQADLFQGGSPSGLLKPGNLKDPGQREDCGCILSKDIGSYNTCPHMCVYCYANSSPELVSKRFQAHNTESESI